VKSRRNLLLQPAVKRAIVILRSKSLIYPVKVRKLCETICIQHKTPGAPHVHNTPIYVRMYTKQSGEKVEY